MSLRFAAISALCLGLLTPACGFAATLDLMIGDDDGYGEGVIDGAVITSGFRDWGHDNRSSAEQAATDGAQQTDVNSALYSPLGNRFTFNFGFVGVLTSATFTLDIGGLQANLFGETLALFNNVLQSNFLNYTESDYGQTRLVSVDLNDAQLAAANAAQAFTFTMDRNNNSDAIFVDYLRLAGEVDPLVQPVPLPATLPLVLAGLGGLAALRRRARKA